MQKALDGLFMGKMQDGVKPFRSLHESYIRMNGLDPWQLSKSQIADGIMYGLANATAPNLSEQISWTSALGDTLHRSLVSDYALPTMNDWQLVTSDIVNLNDMKAQRIERLGYYNTMPVVNPGGTYTEPASPANEEANFTPAKYGRLESYTWEDALNDDIGALRKIPGRLAIGAKLTLNKTVFDLFDTNPTVTYDSTAIFATSADRLNRGSGALTAATLTTAMAAMRSQSALSASNLALSVKPKYLLVGPALEATAKELRDGNFFYNTDHYDVNPWRGTFEIIVVDTWITHPTYWFLVADPRMYPTVAVGFLNGNQEPELMTEAVNSGSSFTADKVYFKVRFVFGTAVIDHRGMYGYIA
jgi:hypothetical protein